MLEPALRNIADRRAKFLRSCEEIEKVLYEYRETFLLASEWLVKNFERRVKSLAVSSHPSEFSNGCISFEATIVDGEAWTEVLELLELLEARGVDASKWASVDDPKQFSRTFTASLYKDASPTVQFHITLALREGNLGGCRRVYVGKEAVSSVRDKYVLICDDVPAFK